MAEVVVSAQDVGFTYKPHGVSPGRLPPTLRGVSLEVRRGEVFGVLGPNGAGKTTILKILSTLLIHDTGRVEVLGHELPRGEREVRPRLAIAQSESERTFHLRLTGRQNLRFFAAFHGMGRAAREAGIAEALDQVGLAPAADQMFFQYSTGMKHRLSVARALLSKPDLLVFDEPTAGLDAQSSRQLGDLIRRLAREEKATVLYTTHRLEEAGRLCDRIAIVRRGRVIAQESPDALRRLSGGTSVLALRLDADDAGFADAARGLDGVRAVYAEGRGAFRLHVARVEDTLPEVVALAQRRGRAVATVRSDEPTVEDAFLALTKEVELTVVE